MMKKMIACLLTLALALTAVCALAEGSLTFSWWGGDARHEATQQAVEAFKAATGIDVQCTYSAWSGWEDKMSQYFASDSAFDVNQINWNWLYSFTNADGSSKFYDLNQVADIIDLSQFDEKALAQCTIDGKLLAIPVAMTGRIFYWNKTTFEKAGLATPTTLEELMAAGPIFAEKLGEDYYPLALGAYDKMILMVYYLESVYGKDWVADGQLNYTTEEIAKGLEFIQTLEDNHVIPSAETLTGDGADSLDKNPKWMEGKYAGIFEWDSSASKFEKSLSEGQEFIVGNYFADMGEYHGGFTKVSLGVCHRQHRGGQAGGGSAHRVPAQQRRGREADEQPARHPAEQEGQRALCAGGPAQREGRRGEREGARLVLQQAGPEVREQRAQEQRRRVL